MSKVQLTEIPEISTRDVLQRYAEWERAAWDQGEDGHSASAYHILMSIAEVALDNRGSALHGPLAREVLALLVV